MVDKPIKGDEDTKESKLESRPHEKEPPLRLDRINASKEDGRNMFMHKMPGLKSEKSNSGAKEKSDPAEKELANPGEKGQEKSKTAEKWDSRKNTLADPEDTANSVANAIRKYEQMTGGKVYDNKLWVQTTMGKEFRVGDFLYSDEGRSLMSLSEDSKVLFPLRSGAEFALYNRIKAYSASHDMTDPSQKITQEQIMSWSLQVNADENRDVTVQEALLTAHNVMKALARPGTHLYQNLPEDDPVRHIIEDCITDKLPRGREPGLSQIMNAKYDQHGIQNVSGQWMFDKENPYSVFKANCDDRDASTGSAYHFWVGAFAASTLGPGDAKAMIFGEGEVKRLFGKSGPLAEQEKPWGGAGVNAWMKMPVMKWSVKN
ncbi:MAG: hypothetical protein K2X77_00225 [Candidatus Obscuribacterales bacterium]|jgi:hypothetical protein|nr:hypothetical protein [Candidatus Obscuribacterales bacterium]